MRVYMPLVVTAWPDEDPEVVRMLIDYLDGLARFLALEGLVL